MPDRAQTDLASSRMISRKKERLVSCLALIKEEFISSLLLSDNKYNVSIRLDQCVTIVGIAARYKVRGKICSAWRSAKQACIAADKLNY